MRAISASAGLLLIGRLDEAEQQLAALDPTALPAAAKAVHEVVVAGIALRHLQSKTARAALARAETAARLARIPALTAEVESAFVALKQRRAGRAFGNEGVLERPVLLDEVEVYHWPRRLWLSTPVVSSCAKKTQ